MKRLQATAQFDGERLPDLPTTSESLAAHVLKLVRLDPVDVIELMSTDEGMGQISAGMTFQDVDTQMPAFDEVVEAKPGRMNARELANMLTGGTRDQAAHLVYSKKPTVRLGRLSQAQMKEMLDKTMQSISEPYLKAALLPGEKPQLPDGLALVIDVFKARGGDTSLDQQIDQLLQDGITAIGKPIV